MLEALIVIGTSIHLLAVNLASAGPLVCIWLHFRGKADPLSDSLGKSLAWASFVAFLVGALTGTILLFAVPSEGLQEAIERFPARAYHMAGYELIFSFVLMLAYAFCWKPMRSWRWSHALISLLAATNLIYHFPPLMLVLGRLASNPNWSHESLIDRPVFLELMARPEIFSLTVHFGLASIAVAAVAALVLLSRYKMSEDQQSSQKAIARGASFVALVTTLIQVPVGTWVIATLSSAERSTLVGGDAISSLMFIGGLLLTFMMLQSLAAIAFGDCEAGTLRRAGLLMILLVLVMTATLRGSRSQKIRTAAENLPPQLFHVALNESK